MRILLVEDDELLGDAIVAGLTQSGFVVDWVRDGITAEHALATEEFAVAVLDINLPRQSGLKVLQHRRAQGSTLPVLLLTARDTVEDRVKGLDAGADDYVVKPFSLDELAARLRALARRSLGRAEPQIVHGGLRVDPASHNVMLDGQQVVLAPREFSILHTLLENRGRALSREQLETALYGWREEVDSNAVEVHIHYLRKKLGSDLIRTLRGVGYMIAREP